MSTESSLKADSLGWQIQKLAQQFGEWLEYQFQSQNELSDIPNPWILPTWLGYLLFWTLIAGFSVWLVLQIYDLLSPYITEWRSPSQQQQQSSVRHHSPKRSPQGWWEQAQTFRQQGQLREACLTLYLGMLQHLQDTQKAPDQKILDQQSCYTDGEYRSMLASESLAQPYRVLIDVHERIIFGDGQASEDLFDRCQRAYREIAPL